MEFYMSKINKDYYRHVYGDRYFFILGTVETSKNFCICEVSIGF